MRTFISKIIPRIFFFILCAVCALAFAADKPTAYDVDALWQEAYQTVEDFHEQSLSLRLKYDHAGTFVSDEHKSKLLTLGNDADSKLKEVYNKQRHLRADIEAYDSDDWDKLYGVTGLWKSVYASEFETQRLKIEVAYYIALALPEQKRLKIADSIIGWCESDKNRFKNAQTKLLKAKASAIIGETSKGYKQQATNIVGELVKTTDHDEVYFRAVLLRFDIVGDVNRTLLTEMAEEIAKSEYSDDFELNVRVAFAGLKVGNTKYLDEVMAKWPGGEKLIAEIILDRLAYLEKNGKLSDDLLARQSFSEIVLAINAAIEKSAADYIRLLERLERTEKFRCSLLSYALAQAYVNDEPVLAVEHYIAAATRRNIDKTLSITKIELAQKGASIASELYGRDKKYCGIAGRALLFYCRAAGADADAETATLYFKTLDACLGEDKAAKQLERLAGSEGYFADVVSFEIARRKIKNDPTKQNYVNAVKVLAGAEHHCRYMRNAGSILYDICTRIEEYAQEYPAFIDDCYFIAKQIGDCGGDPDRRLELVKIGFGVLAGADSAELWQEFEAIDDGSTDAMRCRARLMQAMGQYAQAAVTWEKLQKNNDPKASYSWWQGKFYELWCLLQVETTKKADIAHAVEVLKSSYDNIPLFWAKKLGEL